MPPGVAVPAAFPGNPPPPPCRSPPLVIHRGGGGTVTWSTQNFLLRLIVLLSSYAESFRFMLQFLCLWPANVACTVVVRSPRGGGGGPSLGHHPQGGGRGPSSLGWGRTRGGRVSDSALCCVVLRCMRCVVLWCGVVWCVVVWCGVVWCGVVWCGVVWCGVVWCGVVWPSETT